MTEQTDPPGEAGNGDPELSIAARAGGYATFRRIVDEFYRRVEGDEILRPVYPDELEPGKTHLAQFLTQYFGGGSIYSEHRGHPRLRMRHGPFRVTRQGAAHWLAHMSDAIRAQDLPGDVEGALLDYIAFATPQMINQPDGPEGLPLA